MKNLRIVLRTLAPNKIRVLGLLWLALVLAGLWYVSRYENTPGIAAAAAPLQFPDESSLKQTPGRPTLIMLVHPQCPCTRASIGELNLLMAQTQDHPATVYVCFSSRRGSPMIGRRRIPGKPLRKFPALKSSRISTERKPSCLAARPPVRLFCMTPMENCCLEAASLAPRGHAGDNDGRTAIVRLLNGEQPAQTETAVYGCPLFNKDACPMHQ